MCKGSHPHQGLDNSKLFLKEVSKIRSTRFREIMLLEENRYGRRRGKHLRNVASKEKASKGENYTSCKSQENYILALPSPLNRVDLTKRMDTVC